MKQFKVKFINQSKNEAIEIMAYTEKAAKEIFARLNNIVSSSYIVIVRK